MNTLHIKLNSMNISSSVCQPFPLSARSSIHRPLCLSFPLCVRPLIRPSGFLSIRTSVRLFVRLSVQYSVGLWVRPSVVLSIRPSVLRSQVVLSMQGIISVKEEGKWRCFSLPRVTNLNILFKISIHHQEMRL